eukprot:jgi/Hompol1/1101/HPOL_001634-RA
MSSTLTTSAAQTPSSDASSEQRNAAAKHIAELSKGGASGRAAAGISMDIEDEPVPTTQEGREAYFNKYLVLGERHVSRGPAGYEAAALCLFRALKVYHDPMQLLSMLQHSLPEPVLQMIVELMAADVRSASGPGARVVAEDIE